MKKVLILAFAACMFFACQTKDSYVSDFTQFIEEVEAGADGYSDKDWEKADAKFQQLSGDIYQKFADELTSEEKLEIAKYQTIYSALRGKAGLKNFGESLKEAAKKAQDALEENKD